MTKKTLKIATRKSPMALWQANFVKDKILEKHADIEVELVGMVTKGDKDTKSALVDIGGKSVFVKELQTALLNKTADIAVHSLKDMSVQTVAGLTLAAICERHDPRDALVSNNYKSVDELPKNAVVGTGSPRRSSLIKAMRADLEIKLLRGNVNTRLQKLDDGQYDAIILAASGLKRINFNERIAQTLDPETFIPAIGQGALSVECREDDQELLAMLDFINHKPTEICVTAERAVNKKLGGDCHTPIGAFATIENNTLHLRAMVANEDGSNLITSEFTGDIKAPEELGNKVADDLLQKGAASLLSK